MKWIRSVFRGTLAGGVEQFQWKMDWGNPGNDPTLGEAEAGAFAEFLAEQWAAVFIAQQGVFGALNGLHNAQMKYAEVGVASWTQNAAKNADGSGGDASQDYPNAFHSYAVGAQPVGIVAGSSLPLEVSCAVTLQTNKRGQRGRGRLYLPPFAGSVTDTNGLFSQNAPMVAAMSIGSLIDAVEGSTYGYKGLVVSMREKVLNEIVEVNAGKVPDSQRRRRRSQDEARVVGWTSV